MQNEVRMSAVTAVHTGYLTRCNSSLKLYIPQGQIDQAGYETQTLKHHVVFLATMGGLCSASTPKEAGEFFLVQSSSMALTRHSLLPKRTDLFGDSLAEDVVVDMKIFWISCESCNGIVLPWK